MHKRRFNEFTLNFTIRPQGPLLIKSGQESGADPTLLDMNFVRTHHGRLGDSTVYLPGSSLKGTLRSYAEKVARTLGEERGAHFPPFSCNPLGSSAHRGRDDYYCGKYLDKKGDQADKHRLACPICRTFGHTSLASHLRLSDAYPMDLLQPETMTWFKSEIARHFTAGRGASFETYAGIRIRGSMIDALRKLDWAPRSVHRKAREVAQAIREIERDTGREARDVEVAQRMGLSLDEYHRIVHDSASCQLASLDDGHVVDRGDDTLDPFREAVDDGFRSALAGAIDELPERERLVMSLYYQDELNLKEIGAVLKVTESRVCQLHGQALLRLKSQLTEWRA